MVERAGLNGRLVTVFGGSGFLGRHVVRALAKRGYRVRAAVRRPDLAHHLQPLGIVGQIHAVQANLRYRWSVDRAVEGSDAVVNCVGILAEAGRQRFDAVQGFGPRAIAEAARAAGLSRIVHVSAIGADPESPAAYGRSKAEGEKGVLETLPDSIVFRPSVIFGPEDTFFNRFADMAALLPVLPITSGDTRFQPVFVGDVAEAIARAVDGAVAGGTVYELGGPEADSFKGLMQTMLEVIGRKRPILDVPAGLMRIPAGILQYLPGQLMTMDQIAMLCSHNTVSEKAVAEGRTLSGIGVTPTAMGAILPSYLWRFRKHGQFAKAE